MLKILTVAAVLLLATADAPALACGISSQCMQNPAYESCVSAAQNTKESCNSHAGTICDSVCASSPNPGSCTASCLTNQFDSCQSWYCMDMSMCLEQVCYQN